MRDRPPAVGGDPGGGRAGPPGAGLRAGSRQAYAGYAVSRAVGLHWAVTTEGYGPCAPSDGGLRPCCPPLRASIPETSLLGPVPFLRWQSIWNLPKTCTSCTRRYLLVRSSWDGKSSSARARKHLCWSLQLFKITNSPCHRLRNRSPNLQLC